MKRRRLERGLEAWAAYGGVILISHIFHYLSIVPTRVICSFDDDDAFFGRSKFEVFALVLDDLDLVGWHVSCSGDWSEI